MPYSPLVVIDGGVLHLSIDKATLHDGGIARVSHLAIAMHSGGGDIGSGEGENHRHIGTCKIDGAEVVGLDSVSYIAKADITAVVQGVGLDMQIVSFALLVQADADVKAPFGSCVDDSRGHGAIG